MGGKALIELGVARLPADHYFNLVRAMEVHFKALFGEVGLQLIPAYKTKPDYGDGDFLLDYRKVPKDWAEELATHIGSKGYVVNASTKASAQGLDCISMEYRNFQFDFINSETFDPRYGLIYHAYNDLGNLMGHIAAYMGFRFGPRGLYKQLMNGTDLIEKIYVDDHPGYVFNFLGFDFTRYQQGFDTLEDIFEFVTSSKYYHPNAFTMDHQNHRSRVRDTKRPTYTKFLEWCVAQEGKIEIYPWGPYGSAELEIQRNQFMRLARIRFEKFASQLDSAQHEHHRKKTFKGKWNGENVTLWTGFQGKQLGELMRYCQAQPEFTCLSTDKEALKAFAIRCAADFQLNLNYFDQVVSSAILNFHTIQLVDPKLIQKIHDNVQERIALNPVGITTHARKVFLVATGELFEGRETFTRRENVGAPLCEHELLYTAPPPEWRVPKEDSWSFENADKWSRRAFNSNASEKKIRQFMQVVEQQPEFQYLRPHYHALEHFVRKLASEISEHLSLSGTMEDLIGEQNVQGQSRSEDGGD